MIKAKPKKKINCWEFIKCGREPDGAKAGKLGVCPAAIFKEADGIHGGKNAGRCCWVVAGTFCKGEIQGEFARKILDCLRCPFHDYVLEEEEGKNGKGFMQYNDIFEELNKRSKRSQNPR